MVAYWLLLFAPASTVVAPARLSNVVKGVFIFLAWLGLTLVIGGRYEVGCDWLPYLDWYYSIGRAPFWRSMQMTDPAFGIINWVCYQLGLGVVGVNTVCAGIFSAGLLAFCRRQPLPWLTLVAAVPMLVVVVSMGFTRQATAIGILMFAFNAFIDRKIAPYLMLVALAACFHATSVVFAPAAYFLDPGKRSSLIVVLASSAAMIMGVFLQNKLQQLVQLYIDNRLWEGEGTAAIYRLGLNAFAGGIVMLTTRMWRRLGDDLTLYRLFAVIAIVSFPFSFIEPVASDRLGIYLLPLQAAVFGRTPILFGWNRLGAAFVFGTIAASALLMFAWFRFAIHSYCWVPYQNAWF